MNASPKPFTNRVSSFSEELFLGILLFLVVMHPVSALVVAILTVAAAVLLASWVGRGIRRLFQWRSPDDGRLPVH